MMTFEEFAKRYGVDPSGTAYPWLLAGWKAGYKERGEQVQFKKDAWKAAEDENGAISTQLTAVTLERDQNRLMLEEAQRQRDDLLAWKDRFMNHQACAVRLIDVDGKIEPRNECEVLKTEIASLRSGREQALDDAFQIVVDAKSDKPYPGNWNDACVYVGLQICAMKSKPAVTGEQNAATTATSTEDSVRTCAESSGRSVAAPESRSILRRKAAQNGEPAPEFPPAVTGEKEGA